MGASGGGKRRKPDSGPPRIVVYTSPTCHWCRVAKAYLKDHDLPYTEVDIITDKRGRRDMVAMTGQYGVPVIKVGHRAMVGWDKKEFKALLSGDGGRR